MAVTGAITTFYVDSTGVDLGRQLIEKDYLISVYPHLIPTFKNAGLFAWGDNASGSLGDNSETDRLSPVQTTVGGTNWKQVAAGEAFALGIKTDGTLWSWGRNNRGQLGENAVNAHKSTPIQVGTNSNWRNVACCLDSSFAIKTDGTLWAWGYNNAGQLGDGTLVHKSSPTQIGVDTTWLDISGGQYHVGAIKVDGTLWCWGQGASGRLGDNFAVSRSNPVQIGTLTDIPWEQVSCGSTHTAAIKTDGTLWTWGFNGIGQLGDGTLTTRSSPVKIGSEQTWKQVSAGESTTYAIKTDGSLWAWGVNLNGQLGDNTNNHKSSPVQVVGNKTNWNKVSAGKYFCSAIKTNGTLWSWGNNSSGELGDNTNVSKNSPVQTVSAGQTWKTLGKLNSYCDSNYVIKELNF